MIFFKKRNFCVLCSRYKSENDIKFLYKNIGVCRDCYSKIKTTKDKTFPASGHVSAVISPYINQGKIKDAVKRFKFSGQRLYGDLFGEMMYEEIKEYDWLSEYDYIIPVPLHETRLSERGYNQSEILADKLSECLGVTMLNDALFRIRATKKQSNLSGLARKENVQGAFYAYPELVKDKRILLIDDIHTAGETVMACADALKIAGTKEILAITLLKTIY